MNFDLNFDFNSKNNALSIHSLHPYPAKFPSNLPRVILKKYSKEGDIVLDPFCGSGTTLVEASLQHINAIGVDVNGLSSLLSKVKVTPLNKKQISIIKNFSSFLNNTTFEWKLGKKPPIQIKDIEGIDHWFQFNVSEELTFIIDEINKLSDNDVKDFLKIVLSSIIVRVSNQDSDTRYAAISKHIGDCFTIDLFIKRLNDYLLRIVEFSKQVKSRTSIKIFNSDSRDLHFINPDSVDLIITSPPYANTYDYYLYHKFRKRWLDIDVHYAQHNEIGSRREYSSLKKEASKWTKDLILCFKEMNTVLKQGGYAFIVIGDSVINKRLIKIDEVIGNFINEINFTVCKIISSDLSTHSKIFNPTFAKKGKKEHLIILQKVTKN